jgi:hypothetical protein
MKNDDARRQVKNQNGGSNPNNNMRQSGGSVNYPHGGHDNLDTQRRGPNPDPIEELVPRAW